MVSKVRGQRIADRIREELSEILLMESLDPRLGGITITDVEVDRELDYANVYVSALEGSTRSKEILTGLGHAAGFLRSELSRRIQLRSFPKLRFHWDSTSEKAESIERLFQQLQEEEQSKKQDTSIGNEGEVSDIDAEGEDPEGNEQ